MNILIVEDETDLAKEISSYLTDFKYNCTSVSLLNSAIDKLAGKEFAVALVDLKLPDGHGISLIEYIKKKKISAGVIVISAIDELDTKITALDAGADDFLVKPFHLSELNARIKALIRRNMYQGNSIVSYNEIEIDSEKFLAKVSNVPITLTGKEYDLLLYFISNAGKVITKEAIGYSVWNSHADMDISNEIIYTHVKNLRKKLLAAGAKDYIKSVYGVGYKFDY